MTTVYIVPLEKKPALLLSLVFWPNFKFEISPKRLFLREIMAQYTEPFFTVAERQEDADFFAVPYEYFFVADGCPAYLERVFALAKTAGKKVLLFDYTDYVDRKAKIPAHAVLFRVSAYRHHKQHNEIMMPYFVEDMGARFSIVPKKKSARLVVGYCGQSRFGSPAKALRARLKWFSQYLWLRLSGDSAPEAHRRGIFWRARAIALLRAAGMPLLLRERSFYSLHRATVPLDPAVLRREYAENLRECDLALLARGDANQSQRFYEALSACRIPLFIDTDCALPLEDIIDYDRVMLRVPWRELTTVTERVRVWHRETSPDLFLHLEQDARAVYDMYLRMDRFFSIVFNREQSPYASVLFGTHLKINGVTRRFPAERTEALEAELMQSISEAEGRGVAGGKPPQ